MRFRRQNIIAAVISASFPFVVLFFFPVSNANSQTKNPLVVKSKSNEKMLQEAASALASGNLTAAAAILQKLLAAEPRNAAAHTLAGVAADRRNDLKEAETHFAAAVRLSPQSAETRNNYGVVLLRLNKKTEAAREFNASLKINPNQPSALLNLAQIRFAESNLSAARELFLKAKIIAPDTEILRALTIISLQLNERERAAREFKDYFSARNRSQDVSLGELLLNNNLLAEAQREMESVVAEDADNSKALTLLSKVYLKQKNIKSAGKLLESAVARGAADAKIYFALSEVYQAAGFPENAIPAMRLAIEKEPENDFYQARYGLLLIDSKAPAAAIIRMNEAANKFPQSAKIKFVLGIAQFSDGRNIEAEESLKLALKQQTDFVPALAYLGTVYAERGQFSEAAAFYERALAVEAENAVLHYLLADTLLKIQGSERAKIQKHLESAIRFDEQLAGAHLALGQMLARDGNWEKAAARFEQAIRFAPESAEAYYQLGRTLARLKRAEESKAMLEKFKKLNETQTAQRETNRRELVRRLANVRF